MMTTVSISLKVFLILAVIAINTSFGLKRDTRIRRESERINRETLKSKEESQLAIGNRENSQLTVFLVSLFGGFLGLDWFITSGGNPLFIIFGIIKLLTGAGAGVWYVLDLILITFNAFPTGPLA